MFTKLLIPCLIVIIFSFACERDSNPIHSNLSSGGLVLSDFMNHYKLIFPSNGELFSMNSNGQGLTQLTNDDFVDLEPVWNETENSIFFLSKRIGGSSYYLYKMAPPFRTIERVNLDDCTIKDQAINPDGNKISFVEKCGPLTGYKLIIHDIQLSSETQISEMPFFLGDPAWSPDGAKIIFTGSNIYGYDQIWVYLFEENRTIPLTDSLKRHFQPTWSPDGEKVLYCHDDFDNNNFDIYMMNKDGTNKRNLTNHPGRDQHPVWSPDGKQILFVSNREGQENVYVMDSEGKHPKRITPNFYKRMSLPTWSPDGTRISVAASYENKILIVDLESREFRVIGEGWLPVQWGPKIN